MPSDAMSTLYLVATPIGNLEDISARALRLLAGVSLIAAEDTRHTGRLLNHFGISTPMVSYHARNQTGRRETLLAALAGGDVALVSDAGTPGIADPGNDAVKVAIAGGHEVSPIPGPSALVAAVSASGLVEGPFTMLGFLPRRGPDRERRLFRAGASGFPVVIFEAAGRVYATLVDMEKLWGDRQAVILRELTKLYEEIVRGTLSDLAERYRDTTLRGEVVIVIGEDTRSSQAGRDEVIAIIEQLKTRGLAPSHAAREAAAMTGWSRSDLYQLAQELSRTDQVEQKEDGAFGARR